VDAKLDYRIWNPMILSSRGIMNYNIRTRTKRTTIKLHIGPPSAKLEIPIANYAMIIVDPAI
jgi:hypothetical protein